MTLPRLLLVVLTLASGLPLPAQTLTSLQDSGPRANRVNFVFVGEGYTATESTEFAADATAKLQVLLGSEAWSPFASHINADALFVASAESGADDPATGTVRDTYFNSTFGHHGVDRLIGINAQGMTRLLALLTAFAPDYDVVILLVNAPKYGGSGGFPVISSLSPDSDEVVLHELGHSFAALTDEYVDPSSAPFFLPREYPNATQYSLPAQIPWRAFIQPTTPVPTVSAPDENTVGLFLGSHYRATGFHRPTFNSKMKELGRPFGPVNLRAFATAIHRLNLNGAVTPPVITTQPVGTTAMPGQTVFLTVKADGTEPFTYQWLFNSRYIVNATGETLTLTNLTTDQAGVYAVEVTNAFDAVTSTDATVSLSPPSPGPPRFLTVPPALTNATRGSSVTFSVTAEGVPPPVYQWQKNGVRIPSATSRTLVLNNVSATDAGTYSVEAINVVGSTLSDPFTLIVVVP